MSDIDNLLSKEKISLAMSKPDSYECFVSGLGPTPVSCILSSVAGQTARIKIADGHDTGVEMSVPLSSVAIIGEARMQQAAKDLFRSA